MQIVLDLGVSPELIIFANPFKEISHLKYAARMGVKVMSFDCEMELQKVKQFCPSAKCVKTRYSKAWG